MADQPERPKPGSAAAMEPVDSAQEKRPTVTRHRRRRGGRPADHRARVVGLRRYVVLVVVLVVLSSAAALCAASFVLFQVTSPFDGGALAVFAIIELPLLAGCLALFRHVRRLRWWFPGRRKLRFRRWRAVAGMPAPFPSSATGPSFGYRLSASTQQLSTGLQPAKLEAAEQLLGDTLYELDRTNGRHQLTRQQIVELRVLGLRASAWLNSRTEFAVIAREGVGTAGDELGTGVTRYAALAKAAEGFLAGRVPLRELTVASQKLANWIE
jgi:hypothetical protein